MSTFMPARVPFIDARTGLISREWQRFLNERLGGEDGSSVEQLLLQLATLAGDTSQDPPRVDVIVPDDLAPPRAAIERIESLETQVAELSALAMDLQTKINDISQGVLV